MKIFKLKNKVLFDYFKFEKTADDVIFFGDFAKKDFKHWFSFIHDQIQEVLRLKLIDGNAVENYVNITLHISGQKVDVAIIKDGCKSPHELLQEYKKQSDKTNASSEAAAEGEKEINCVQIMAKYGVCPDSCQYKLYNYCNRKYGDAPPKFIEVTRTTVEVSDA